MAAALRCPHVIMTPQVRQIGRSFSITGSISLLLSVLAGGALLVLPLPGWGWTALRAFLQF
jgi:hypothetical protein